MALGTGVPWCGPGFRYVFGRRGLHIWSRQRRFVALLLWLAAALPLRLVALAARFCKYQCCRLNVSPSLPSYRQQLQSSDVPHGYITWYCDYNVTTYLLHNSDIFGFLPTHFTSGIVRLG